MNNSDLYEKEHKFQRNDAEMLLNKYKYLFKWCLFGNDAMIDIGCGPGDVTTELIQPMLSKSFRLLQGVDISDEMIEHCRKKYETLRIKFDQVNIEGDVSVRFQGKFDHAASIYCFHWVRNQMKAYENVYKLLRRGGDFVFIFLATHPIYRTYRKVVAETKWKAYMEDVENFISPFEDEEEPHKAYENILRLNKFRNIKIFREELSFTYYGKQSAKDNMKAVSPFINRIPKHLHDEHMEAIIDAMVSVCNCNRSTKNDFLLTTPYTVLIGYAQK